METLISYIESGISNIMPFIILLGLLIFVHEMGHFLVAKFYGVRVEVFSLGFGKKIFSFKRGDTEYCLSIVPLGGYVKMFGDDPTAQIDEVEKNYSFLHKPVGQRIAIVLAGPLMNLFFAALLFWTIAMVGEEKPASIIGDVATTSAAFEAGFRSGDQILSINGKEVSFWEEVKETLEKTSGETLEFSVKRFSLSGDGPVEKVSAPTKLVGNTNVLSLESLVGDVPGLELSAVASRVGVAFDSAAYKAGMRPMDIVSSVNGVAVSRWFELEAAFSMVSTTDPTVIEVKRGEGDKEETLKFTFVPTSGNLADSGIEVPELYLAGVEEKSPAEESGIKPGDKIVSISGTTVSKWEELTKVVRSYKEDQGPFEVVVNREGQDKTFKITPTSKSVTSRTGSREEIFALGVHMGVALAIPNLKLYRHANPVMALSRGAYDTWNWSKITVISFIRLIQGKVSARSLGGPLMIGQLAKSAFDIGISAFLKIMAIISINLFILNLLPIPVLDGGHLVFFSIEALRGAPMSMRKMEIAQQIGVVLLFGMMALAIFNDVGRLFE